MVHKFFMRVAYETKKRAAEKGFSAALCVAEVIRRTGGTQEMRVPALPRSACPAYARLVIIAARVLPALTKSTAALTFGSMLLNSN